MYEWCIWTHKLIQSSCLKTPANTNNKAKKMRGLPLTQFTYHRAYELRVWLLLHLLMVYSTIVLVSDYLSQLEIKVPIKIWLEKFLKPNRQIIDRDGFEESVFKDRRHTRLTIDEMARPTCSSRTDLIHIDVVACWHSSTGENYCLTVIDRFSLFIEVFPIV